MPFSGEARFVMGNPTQVDHTPGAAVAAGEVVVVGNTPRIAHLAIAANVLGALAMAGGVYEVAADAAIAAGIAVFWNTTANQVSATSATGAHKAIGFTVTASSGVGAKCLIYHQPAGAVS